jgi:hypothetical protein
LLKSDESVIKMRAKVEGRWKRIKDVVVCSIGDEMFGDGEREERESGEEVL